MKVLKVMFIVLSLMATQIQAQSQTKIDAFSKSYELEYKGEYTKAITEIKNVYDQKSYEINLRLAWLHYSAGLFSESTQYYSKCINLMPMAIEPKLGYVYPATALGEWGKVLTQYQNILKIDPQNANVNYKIGLIYYGKKDYKQAHKYLEKVVNLYPFGYNGLLYLGWTKYFLGDIQKAKVLFGRVLLYSPKDASAQKGLDLIK